MNIYDYLRLICLFYRRPEEAFKIVNRKKVVHGIVAFVFSMFVIELIYYLFNYGVYNIYLGPFPYPFPASVLCSFEATLLGIVRYFIIFGTEVAALVIILKLLKFKFDLVPALSVIFYACALAFPFVESWWVLSTLYFLITGIILQNGTTISFFYFIYVLPLTYFEYIGLKGFLKSESPWILISIVIAVIIHCILYLPEELYLMCILGIA